MKCAGVFCVVLYNHEVCFKSIDFLKVYLKCFEVKMDTYHIKIKIWSNRVDPIKRSMTKISALVPSQKLVNVFMTEFL